MNLMTEYGQTYGFTAATFVDELKKYIDINSLDYVFINKAPIPDKLLIRYKKTQAVPVVNDLSENYSFKVIESDLLSKTVYKRQKGDTLNRSLVRHDPESLARLCIKVMNLV